MPKLTQAQQSAAKELRRLLSLESCGIFKYTPGWPDQPTPEQLKVLEEKTKLWVSSWILPELNVLEGKDRYHTVRDALGRLSTPLDDDKD